MPGRVASSSAELVAVALPWWATLRTSIRGRPRGKQPWVHVVLGVAGEQEAPAVRLAEQDDRRVVDAAAGGRRARRGPRAPATGR